MRALLLGILLAGVLTGCARSTPPVGKWEGGYQANGVTVAARVEIGPDGLVRISAPDITSAGDAKPGQLEQMRQQLAADLVAAWDGVAPRQFDFDGTTFRKPGGVAPQMVWDKATGQMTLELYIGANAALPVPLRPVPEFHDDPWAMG